MRKVGFIVAALVLLSGLALTACQPAAPETFEWRLPTIAYPGAFEDKLMPVWEDYVERESGGRLQVEWFYDGEICPAEEIPPNLAKGLFEATFTHVPYYAGTYPALELGGMFPGVRGSWEETMTLWNDSELTVLIEETCNDIGFHNLGITHLGGYPCLCTTVPIRTVEDFEGVKVRAFGMASDCFAAFGAAPTYMPGGECYMALKLGTVDAVTFSVDGIEGYKWYEVMDYWILPFFTGATNGWWCVNWDSWNELPDDLKDVYLDSVQFAHVEARKIVDEAMEMNYQYAEDGWYEIITLPDEELAKMWDVIDNTVWPDFAAQNERCAKGVEIIKGFYGS